MTTEVQEVCTGSNYGIWSLGENQLFARFFECDVELCGGDHRYFYGINARITYDAAQDIAERLIKRLQYVYGDTNPVPICASEAMFFFAAGIIDHRHFKPGRVITTDNHVEIRDVRLFGNSRVSVQIMSDREYNARFDGLA